MAVSIYDEQFLTEEQKKQLREITAEWDRANASGDQAAMESAHAAAERIRASANYTGGQDGSRFIPTDSGDGYEPKKLPEYRAQTEAVNALYDAARDRKLSELRSAFDAGVEALRAEGEKIPGIYDAQRNDAAARSELSGRNFREYAAASGLNSGTAGQAELARSNQLQGTLTELGAQEGAAQADIARRGAELRQKYASDVGSAIAEGEYQRAAALLDEYRKAEESRVSTAREQAEEDYRRYEAASSERQRASEREYRARQLEVNLAQSRAEKEARQEQERAQAAEKEQKAQAEAAEKAAKAQAEAESRALKETQERAERLASFGDFSGYLNLGYSEDETRAMRQAWISKNPLTAYYTGTITWEEYVRLTGKR